MNRILQYMDMSEQCYALLKHCELDTLAMVKVFEHFKEDLLA